MRRFLAKVMGIMLVGLMTAVFVLPVSAQEQDPEKQAQQARIERYMHIGNFSIEGQMADGTPFRYEKKGDRETITVTYPNGEQVIITARLTSGGNLGYVKVAQMPSGMWAGQDHRRKLEYDLAKIGRDEANNLLAEGMKYYEEALKALGFNNVNDIRRYFEKYRQSQAPQ